MKRIPALAVALILCFCTMGMAWSEADQQKPLGHLTKLGVDEETLNAQIRDTNAFMDIPFSEYQYFDTLSSMILALNTGVIDGFITNEYTYEFIRSREDLYSTFSTDPDHEYSYGFSMLLREADQELCSRISAIISRMKEDGTMDALKRQYVDQCIEGQEPVAIEPAHFDQAPTLKVALTGDIPPMDYFNADGTPAGFNTALITEIGKQLEMNVQFISIDSGARAVSLASGDSDIVFWTEAANYYNWVNADQEDQPENTVMTEIYLPSEIRLVVLKDFPGADQ